MDIKGSVALVTGGASGLGAAAVEMLVDKGAKVVVADLNEEKGKEFAAKFGDNAVFVKCNVTSTPDNEAAVKTAIDKFGKLDILVNAAGIGSASKIIGKDGPTNLDWFKMVIDINLTGGFDIMRLAAWEMSKNTPNDKGERGCLINVASVAAFDGQMGQAAYAASKGGVVSMTLPIARDLSREGIRCNTIAPGIFDTPMMQLLPQAARDSLGAQVPFPKRMGDPPEFAHLVCAIVENPYLNAQAIRLDGAIRMGIK
ncbi:3-hydroxyacyl-CoA dehydrogenase [Syntrophomonas palmitatica]|uniref:3-hydroxyacyl-CoA dehydrogenase n=1 Tax=Syntrophomonas palmitatica TaxID=402877 RepID=UPI0006D1BE0D|nr:3-hydroxyacyl-CoA dehydrogenase [Syntrophomonas palmitatica]